MQENVGVAVAAGGGRGELARVSRGRVVIVQSDWRTLWLDSGDPETAQEFTRLFAGPAGPDAAAPAALLAAAGMRLVEDGVDTIRGERLRPGTYAMELLRLLREFLVVQSAGVRARRFDDWRAELEERAARGAFGLLDRAAGRRRGGELGAQADRGRANEAQSMTACSRPTISSASSRPLATLASAMCPS